VLAVNAVIGLALAVLASLLFNGGLVLQALEAREQPPALGLRVALVLGLLRRTRWLIGLALGLVGVLPQVLALGLAPFVIVQPALVVGLLLVLAAGNRILDERVRPQEWAGVVAIVGGIALVAIGSPDRVEAHRGGATVLALAAVLAAIAIFPFLVRGRRLDTATLLMVASGVGFALTNIAAKLLSDDVGLGHLPNAAAWLVAAFVVGVVATITGMTAFQRARTTIVVPVTTAVQTFLPIILEPLFLREHWSSAELFGAPIAAGLVLACAGTVAVASSPGVGEVVARTASSQAH
jgi:drug/metabolite transporter (DMT)-like permease